jgi:hypothetical protein
MRGGPDFSKPPQSTHTPMLLEMRVKLPQRPWRNVDPMLYERNKSRDQNCRVCRQWHNPETDECGCEPL